MEDYGFIPNTPTPSYDEDKLESDKDGLDTDEDDTWLA